jgi:transcriptional regulator with XRE-family HTH domain
MDNLYEHIGQKIKELRLAFGGIGINQEQLAEKMKTTANTVSRWESATYKPSAMDLHQLAKIFGVNISVFFPAMPSPKIQALMSALGDLGQKDIDELTQYAQFRKARQALKDNKKKRTLKK